MSTHRNPVVLSYGGGVNSPAVLIGMIERQEPIDRIIFADTGDERPDVYAGIERACAWSVGQGYPEIEVVRWERVRAPSSRNPEEQSRLERASAMAGDVLSARVYSLSELSMLRRELPSLAYGFKGCSTKWKRQPLDKAVKAWPAAHAAWAGGRKVVRLIGFDADEHNRAARSRYQCAPSCDGRFPERFTTNNGSPVFANDTSNG